MMQSFLAFLLLCGLAASVVCQTEHPDEHPYVSQFDVGDPRRCLDLGRRSKFPMLRFEVLPGIGWDNLQNIPKGQLIQYNFTRCLTTDDGRFLVPDQVFTIPLKESFVDTFAELLSDWHDTRSTTSRSINANAGLKIKSVSVSGSFSREYTKIKEKQVENDAVTVRIQLRYHRYKSQLQPDAELHPAFKRRLFNIAAHKVLNRTEMAYYEAQLIVRDFGTHIQTSVIAGAGLVKTDFFKRNSITTSDQEKTKILASASGSFASFFKMGANYGHSTDNADYQKYMKSMSHSYVTSYGGPILRAFNMSANDWTNGVDVELVPMDVSGVPLSFFVTQQTLPELPVSLVYEVEKILRTAIVQYYDMNTVAGCTEMESPNFMVSANFDDGSCGAKATNMTFGGVYQTCSVQGEYLSHNPCIGLSQVNPKTGGYSCPTSFTSVKLVTGTKIGVPEHKQKCHSCGFLGLRRCCDNDNFLAQAAYTTYWCAALGQVEPDSGYLFGGFYSSLHNNPLTGARNCSKHFYPRVFLEQKICISENFELGTKNSVPLGGFMSCSVGNPLSSPRVNMATESPHSLTADKSNPSLWPKRCPTGYSQHLAAIDNGCEIRYCLKSGALKGPGLSKIKLPPFEEKPSFIGQRETRVIFDPKTKKWITEKTFNEDFGGTEKDWSDLWSSNKDQKDKDSGASTGINCNPSTMLLEWITDQSSNEGFDASEQEWQKSNLWSSIHSKDQKDEHKNSESSSMESGVIAAIAVGVTAFCIIVLLLVYIFVLHRRIRRFNANQVDNANQIAMDGR